MKNRKILMAGAFPFKAPVRVGIHHYASLFTKQNWKVFFLSSQLSPFHFLRKADRQYSKEKLRLWLKGGEEDSIFSYSYMTLLPIFPFFTTDWILNHTLLFTCPRLYRVISRKGFEKIDILWIENPHVLSLTGRIKHDLFIYRIADDLKGFGIYPQQILDMHEKAVQEADIVITTARLIYQSYHNKIPAERILYVPNGVDFDHFQEYRGEMPEEYRSMKSPIVIYTGMIGKWFDQKLLVKCAEKLKHFNFVIIGPAMVDVSMMKQVSNIHLLGSRRYDNLLAYLKYSDAAIIPFKVNEFVDSIHPVKIYEYMACGLPVIATSWEELRFMNSPALLAENDDEFCSYLENSVEKKDTSDIINFAKNNSWEIRFKNIMSRIETV